MNKAYFLAWLKAAGIRALKTVAQTAVATIGTAIALADVNWIHVLSASVLAGGLSLLTSVAGLPEVSRTTSGTTSGNMEAVPETGDREERGTD